MDRKQFSARCKCGQVELKLSGDPIATTVCHCSSCQTAGKLLDELSGATRVLDAGGGTAFVIFRKDRLRCKSGGARLAEHRLKPDSATRRVVATCCNTAMFLDFTKGHWVSVYEGRLDLHPEAKIKKSGYFVPRLILAWVAMKFRTPKIDFVHGVFDGLKN